MIMQDDENVPAAFASPPNPTPLQLEGLGSGIVSHLLIFYKFLLGLDYC